LTQTALTACDLGVVAALVGGEQLDMLAVQRNAAVKRLALLPIQGSCNRQVNRKRIYLLIVDTEFIVQMGAGSPTGRAYVADELALTDGLAFFNARSEAALMGV